MAVWQYETLRRVVFIDEGINTSLFTTTFKSSINWYMLAWKRQVNAWLDDLTRYPGGVWQPWIQGLYPWTGNPHSEARTEFHVVHVGGAEDDGGWPDGLDELWPSGVTGILPDRDWPEDVVSYHTMPAEPTLADFRAVFLECFPHWENVKALAVRGGVAVGRMARPRRSGDLHWGVLVNHGRGFALSAVLDNRVPKRSQWTYYNAPHWPIILNEATQEAYHIERGNREVYQAFPATIYPDPEILIMRRVAAAKTVWHNAFAAWRAELGAFLVNQDDASWSGPHRALRIMPINQGGSPGQTTLTTMGWNGILPFSGYAWSNASWRTLEAHNAPTDVWWDWVWSAVFGLWYLEIHATYSYDEATEPYDAYFPPDEWHTYLGPSGGPWTEIPLGPGVPEFRPVVLVGTSAQMYPYPGYTWSHGFAPDVSSVLLVGLRRTLDGTETYSAEFPLTAPPHP